MFVIIRSREISFMRIRKVVYVSYLKLIKNKMQNLAEAVALALNIEVVIADKNLTRIVGTGDFFTKIDDVCADDSLFAKVLKTGDPIINLDRDEECKNCSNKRNCREFTNMIYPIKEDDETIGVLSFASFDRSQAEIIKVKKDEYFDMLKETASIIEEDIRNINIKNKIKNNITEVNEIINCFNQGIIILNENKKIIHINSKSLQILNLNISDDKVIDKDINNFIKNIDLVENDGEEVIGVWSIYGKDVRVAYNISKIKLSESHSSIMVSFDIVEDIINLAKTYENKEEIYFENIIGRSKSILKSINKAKVVSSTDSTVLLQGASGTGKELFARSIHNESQRKDGPFVVINCGSIPENLIESELFGYEKGAFTGANTTGKKGKIELANNGTLFLDEIGDLPLYLQTKLLRVLQEKTIDRVGGKESIDINIRIISATNKDLRAMVAEDIFRLDLYYRLNVIPIKLPSLNDREDDVYLISDYIIKSLCKKMNKKEKKLSKDVEKLFFKYSFPGNIRELENILEHGICFSEGEYIKLNHLPEYILEEVEIERKIVDFKGKSLDKLKIDFEKSVIQDLILEHGDTVDGKKQVAEKLGIGLTTLYRKINE